MKGRRVSVTLTVAEYEYMVGVAQRIGVPRSAMLAAVISRWAALDRPRSKKAQALWEYRQRPEAKAKRNLRRKKQRVALQVVDPSVIDAMMARPGDSPMG